MLKLEKINSLIIHCSDTDDDLDLRAQDIHKMHLGFGWDGIGYHKIICKNGDVENGRPEYWVGAHVKGKNTDSLGVCLIGRTDFSKAQFNSLEKLLIAWKKKYSPVSILGHRDVVKTDKTCPNFNVKKWCQSRKLL